MSVKRVIFLSITCFKTSNDGVAVPRMTGILACLARTCYLLTVVAMRLFISVLSVAGNQSVTIAIHQ
jgi:hypothetical protein